MLILFRAMKITEINTEITDAEAKKILSKYKDGDKVSVSSQKAIAICIKEGVLLGNNNYLMIKQNITRVQTAFFHYTSR